MAIDVAPSSRSTTDSVWSLSFYENSMVGGIMPRTLPLHQAVEMVMSEKRIADRAECVVQWESDSMWIYTEVPTVSEASTNPPDLERMAFSRGGQLMSDMKTVLRPDSFKCSKKGYEELR